MGIWSPYPFQVAYSGHIASYAILCISPGVGALYSLFKVGAVPPVAIKCQYWAIATYVSLWSKMLLCYKFRKDYVLEHCRYNYKCF